MKQRRQLAAALACALALGLCGGHVLADGTAESADISALPELISPAPETGSAADGAEQSAADLALTDSGREPIIVEDGQPSLDVEYSDPEGTVSFENLEARLRENNLNILALDRNLDAIDAVDLDEMADGLSMAISMIENQQSQLQQLVSGTSAAVEGLQAALEGQNLGLDLSVFTPALIAYPQATITSLETQIATYRDTLEQIKDGTIEAQYDDAAAQLQNAQNQIVMGAETLYISLLGLDQTTQSLERNLAALDRTLAELEVRYEMGQISALTLAEAKSGRTTLVSSMQTLEMNVTGLKRQLEAMLGEDITGTIRLSPLNAVTSEQLAKLDYDADLKKVKRYSYELEAANNTWHDAEEDYRDLRDSKTAADYEVESARYAAKAADLTKQATEQSIELKFASLYDQVHDQQQVLAAAKTALVVKEDSYAAAQLKYEQGTLSKNALLDARDAMETAQDTVDTAAVDLFTYYNNYCWAIEHGILN